MTIEERAEKILEELGGWSRTENVKYLTAQIKAAIEEDRASRCADDLYKGCYEKGLKDAARGAAIEEL